MENKTKTRLEQAGWHKNRTIDMKAIELKYAGIDLTMPGNVREFLREFGMLKIEFTNIMQYLIVDEVIEFNPIEAIGINLDKEYFREVLQDYGIDDEVYPIGVANRGNLLMLMTKDNVFYRFTDGFLCIDGKNIDEMLDCVVGECFLPDIIAG